MHLPNRNQHNSRHFSDFKLILSVSSDFQAVTMIKKLDFNYSRSIITFMHICNKQFEFSYVF